MFEGWAAAGAIVGSAAVGAIGANMAANTQAGAAANAQQISQNEFNTITAQETPYMQSGYGALSALDYGLGIGPQTQSGAPVGAPSSASGANPNTLSGLYGGPLGTIGGGLGGSGIPLNLGHATAGQGMPTGTTAGTTGVTPSGQGTGLGYGSLTAPFTTANWQQLSPAYNFQLQQGQQGVLNADAAGAGSLSGSAMKDLINYNQGAANTSFNNAFNQYQTQQGNIFSRLSGIAQLGQSSAANTGQQGTALAGQAAQSATNIGTAQAGGIVGASNAITGGLSSALPWLYGGSGGSDVTPSVGNYTNSDGYTGTQV